MDERNHVIANIPVREGLEERYGAHVNVATDLCTLTHIDTDCLVDHTQHICCTRTRFILFTMFKVCCPLTGLAVQLCGGGCFLSSLYILSCTSTIPGSD